MSETQPLAQAVTVRLATADDDCALLRLHNEGFGSDWTLSQWRRRFVDNPTRRAAIAAAFTHDGTCVAAFCGVPLPARYRGEPGLCLRAGDVVVHPRLRQSVAGSKLLVRTGSLFFDSFGGGRTRVIYGCPELGLRRTAVRHLRCDVLGDLPVLVHEVHGPAPPRPGDVVVTTVQELPDDFDAMCAAWNEQIPTGLVRDAEFLRWRYLADPVRRYQLLLARGPTGALRGLAVVHRGGLHESALSLVEWFAPPGDDATGEALIHAANELARAQGLPALVACFAPMSPEFLRLQHRHRFHVRMSHHQIVYRSYAAGHDRRFLFDEWFYSLGDFDFG